MSKKRWNVSVDLVTLGQITELHSGPYANDWWLNHGGVVNENSSYLYPIRVGQQTRVVVKEMPFTLTVFVHKEGDHCVPAYRCDSRNYVGEKKVLQLQHLRALTGIAVVQELEFLVLHCLDLMMKPFALN